MFSTATFSHSCRQFEPCRSQFSDPVWVGASGSGRKNRDIQIALRFTEWINAVSVCLMNSFIQLPTYPSTLHLFFQSLIRSLIGQTPAVCWHCVEHWEYISKGRQTASSLGQLTYQARIQILNHQSTWDILTFLVWNLGQSGKAFWRKCHSNGDVEVSRSYLSEKN